MSVRSIARGGLLLFVASMGTNVIAYVYWVVVSIFAGQEAVGITSAILSLASVVSTVALLGIPYGASRFLGREVGFKNIEGINKYFWTCLILTLTLSLMSAIVVWAVALLCPPLSGFSQMMLIFAAFAILLNFSGVIYVLFVSTIKTSYIAMPAIASGVVKLVSGAILVYIGLGWFGAVIGALLSSLFLVVSMLLLAIRQLKRLGHARLMVSRKALRESMHAGLANWVPSVVVILGQQLSILAVFGFQGTSAAGMYFIAFTIFSVVYALPSSFMSFLFPVLSGLSSGAEEAARKALRLCLALACPITAFLMLYSILPLSLIPGNYGEAAPTLSILVLSTIPSLFAYAVDSLVYASGSYGKVLCIDLSAAIPRVVLYYQLVPSCGGFGAALSFLTGSVTGFIVAAIICERIRFRVAPKKIMVATIVPFTAALACFLAGLNWLVGGIIILLVSVPFYGRLGIVERNDLAEIARAFASEKTVTKIGGRLSWVLRIIYGG